MLSFLLTGPVSVSQEPDDSVLSQSSVQKNVPVKLFSAASASANTPADPSYDYDIEHNAQTLSSKTHPEKETISLDLRGVAINEFFKLLSKKLDKNIIPSKNVTGRINLFLNNVNYADILDIIMLSQGLAYEEKAENVIIVMTEAEYEAVYGKKFNEKRELITLKARYASPEMIFTALSNLKSSVGNVVVDELTGTIIVIDTPEKLKDMREIFVSLDIPRVTEVFELQYAKAADMENSLSSLITEGSGSLLADERTNTIVVTDLPGNMHKIKQTVKMMDQETKQVFIEAEILQITLSDEFNYGIEWQKILSNPSLWGTVLTGAFPGSGMTSGYQNINTGSTTEHNFSAAINVLKSIGDVKVLSSPKIAVTNNEEAVIHVGRREAIVTGTLSQSGESTITSDSVEFVDVGVKLVVVPTINRDGYVTIKIKPEVSTAIDEVRTGSATEPRSIIPIISTSEAETTVKVKDGAMIMIAGLRENDTRSNIDGAPFLCDIPILGSLFSNNDSSQEETEIIIFLTPHIIRGDEMMGWDREKFKEYPVELRPENRDLFEPKFDINSLRNLKKSGR
ncbi:MAG: secretin N-terminal domain-containing protein [Candidatus Omnitrophota bacterium]